ncbi:hypothetical protein [Mesorhizobium sp. WSM3876]|uniref:hypothetical protein n=1 Tax=Mesorhizobium sp. WSM3876 TaxID=422277 RepID=UPI000BDBE03E|nr:hypothetical protein [Mesorhizobium sp. WSM3876]PBB84589.1 hypothetical protein CK216_21940 [Mesorhizobium sp. WSM3876]
MTRLAIAISSGMKPLVRTVHGRTKRLVYLSNPEHEASIRSGESTPLGFPIEDVYEYDAEIFAEMEAAWRKGTPTLHRALRPLADVYREPR